MKQNQNPKGRETRRKEFQIHVDDMNDPYSFSRIIQSFLAEEQSSDRTISSLDNYELFIKDETIHLRIQYSITYSKKEEQVRLKFTLVYGKNEYELLQDVNRYFPKYVLYATQEECKFLSWHKNFLSSDPFPIWVSYTKRTLFVKNRLYLCCMFYFRTSH